MGWRCGSSRPTGAAVSISPTSARALAADTAHAIKAVCVVHNETATGMMLPLPAIRAGDRRRRASGAVPGRYDFLARFARIPHGRMEDRLRRRRQPEGPDAAHRHEFHRRVRQGDGRRTASAKLHRFYFDWTMMANRVQKSFIGTIPVNIFYGLREVDPPAGGRRSRECRRAAHAAGRGDAARRPGLGRQQRPATVLPDAGPYSDSVTAVLMPDGFNADALRKTVRDRFNVSLGGGLGRLGGKIFRIGHLGDLNEPMLLGALAAIEMALRIEGIPHGRGGVDAAMAFLAQQLGPVSAA